MKTISNEQKAIEIVKKNLKVFYVVGNSYNECYQSAMQMAQWKDEQYKQDNSIFINYLKEWACGWLIEQLTSFAVHLNKRGAFRDDLCMDFEHEAQSFVESQKTKKL